MDELLKTIADYVVGVKMVRPAETRAANWGPLERGWNFGVATVAGQIVNERDNAKLREAITAYAETYRSLVPNKQIQM